MSCPKAERTGAWACGRPSGHLGGHLSAAAVEQLQALLKRLNDAATELVTQWEKKPTPALQMRTLLVAARVARTERMLNGLRK